MEEEKERPNKMEDLDLKIKDAKENLGDTEIRDAYLDKAYFLKESDEKEEAIKVFQEAISICRDPGRKVDILFEVMSIELQDKNLESLKVNIDKSKTEYEKGLDWERRNRLKVFEGMYNLLIRNFSESATLLLEAATTFTAKEFIPFHDLIFYATTLTMVSLDRATLNNKVIHNPEILTEIREIPYLKEFAESFFNCDYKSLFRCLLEIVERVKNDKFMKKHEIYWCRQMRLVAYSQFLQSYKTVKMESMAEAFGMSVGLLDKELSHFISMQKLTSSIDKVKGVIHTDRPNTKIAMYKNTIREADFILNRMQKLSRVLEL